MREGCDILQWLRPSHSVPVTRWRSQRRWTANPGTLTVLVVGLTLFGIGEALVVVSDLGNGPWTVLAQGVSVRSGLSIGWTTFIISVLVLLLWIPLKERPGLGTIANAIIIAGALQIGVNTIPHPTNPVVQLVFVIAGIACIGFGSGLYLTTNLGPGPRDGWMTGIHRRTNWPISLVRLGIEVTVVIAGWLLGGTVGLGTVLFALLIGPFVGYGLRITGRIAGARETTEAESEPELEA
jgi:uncharacterized membrane protein YczE